MTTLPTPPKIDWQPLPNDEPDYQFEIDGISGMVEWDCVNGFWKWSLLIRTAIPDDRDYMVKLGHKFKYWREDSFTKYDSDAAKRDLEECLAANYHRKDSLDP